MSNTQKWTLGCLALAVIVLLGGGVLALVLFVPGVEEQMPPGVSSLIVTLSTPLNDTQVPLNQFTTISAEALGIKPITALELWIDGTPSETKNAPAGSALFQFAASWTWIPASEGEHTLLVRAIDADTSVGMSNVVRVTASKDANVVPSVAYEAKPGDTVSSLAQKVKTSPQQIVDLNPQVNPSGTITPGQIISVPVPPPPVTSTVTPTPEPPPTPPPGPADPPKGPPNKNILWIGSLISKLVAVNPPTAPGLTASVAAGKCSIYLYIDDKSNNEDGFYLYRLDPNAFGFKHIAILDAHSGAGAIQYVDPVSTGKYQYYVAAFNAAGKSDSKIVKAAIIEPCGAPAQSLGIDKGIVTVKQPVDNIYCYLQIDSGPWTRIPPSGFIQPTKPGEFDVSQYLKSLTPPPPPPKITLHLECWGWKGNTLIYLGEATETINQGPVKLVGNNFQLAGNLAAQLQLISSIPNPTIAPPVNAKMTADPKECLNHASPNALVQALFSILCQGAADKGYQFLVWDWNPTPGCWPGNPCPYIKDTDGFHVYMYYLANPPKLIDTINDRQHRVSIIPPKSAPMFPPFFYVRAFQGASESANSNEVQSIATQAKVTLSPSAMTWRDVYNHKWNDAPGCFYSKGLGPPPAGAGEILVGHDRWYDSGTICWEGVTRFMRGAVWFDLSKIKGNIVDARLQYRYTSGEYAPGPEWAGLRMSCASRLMFGTEDWRGKDYGNQPVTIPGVDYVALDTKLKMYYNSNTGTHEAFPFQVDVTSAVKQWTLGKPNYGFILAGGDENLGAQGNDWCYSRYTDFVLTVNYQPTGQ